MAELIHEIWHDQESHSFEMSVVSKQTDEQRQRMNPKAVKVYTFVAQSDYEAAQKNYDWHGWGQYDPEPGWPDRFFTDEEAEEQRRYMTTRTV